MPWEFYLVWLEADQALGVNFNMNMLVRGEVGQCLLFIVCLLVTTIVKDCYTYKIAFGSNTQKIPSLPLVFWNVLE